MIKLAVLVTFVVVGLPHIDFHNLSNFLPFGWEGVWPGASLIIFAYLGFDAISTVAEETKNPGRNIPLGLIISLALSVVFFILVSFTLWLDYRLKRGCDLLVGRLLGCSSMLFTEVKKDKVI